MPIFYSMLCSSKLTKYVFQKRVVAKCKTRPYGVMCCKIDFSEAIIFHGIERTEWTSYKMYDIYLRFDCKQHS